jgi:hypothetical protein
MLAAFQGDEDSDDEDAREFMLRNDDSGSASGVGKWQRTFKQGLERIRRDTDERFTQLQSSMNDDEGGEGDDDDDFDFATQTGLSELGLNDDEVQVLYPRRDLAYSDKKLASTDLNMKVPTLDKTLHPNYFDIYAEKGYAEPNYKAKHVERFNILLKSDNWERVVENWRRLSGRNVTAESVSVGVSGEPEKYAPPQDVPPVSLYDINRPTIVDGIPVYKTGQPASVRVFYQRDVDDDLASYEQYADPMEREYNEKHGIAAKSTYRINMPGMQQLHWTCAFMLVHYERPFNSIWLDVCGYVNKSRWSNVDIVIEAFLIFGLKIHQWNVMSYTTTSVDDSGPTPVHYADGGGPNQERFYVGIFKLNPYNHADQEEIIQGAGKEATYQASTELSSFCYDYLGFFVKFAVEGRLSNADYQKYDTKPDEVKKCDFLVAPDSFEVNMIF